jgi:hypothetical protein
LDEIEELLSTINMYDENDNVTVASIDKTPAKLLNKKNIATHEQISYDT